MIVIAHVSDIHVDGEPRSVDRTRAVLRHLEELPYDLAAVLVTGDLADHGTPQEYAVVRELLRSRHPLLACPGNHDERAAFRAALLAPATTAEAGDPAGPAAPSDPAAPVNQVLRGEGFVIALCDSSVPGKDEGFLEDATLAWLDGVLADTPHEVPVLVAFHHPPVPLHTPYVDGIRQFGEERLAALADRHPHLTAFLAGHAHTAAATTFAGRPLLVAPGVVSSLRLPWEHPGANPHVHLDQPPALAFHVLGEDGRLTTHYRTVTG
ncbi:MULTISPECIES: metallophosphoesterase [unclassified Streptomyces]|uniref:metallophosphoesterase n=1 Tax=unclassified Streptomyces TaxID=2593676 RepID=UPI0006FBDCA9|nr:MULTISPECIES: metallophosphoesterase [unclassified Streptomyces]KQX51092.1 metallophosphoesterase [Streptomyces sp. Root1304]KRA85256.1 metallophosphoesterase [Streptomyces sp. Root66D1]